jgi:hypothetical protein
MQLAVVLSKRRIKRFNRNVVAVVAATTVLSAVGVAGANTGSGPVKPPQLGAHELPGNLRGESNRFASLEAAVASGVIDAEIVAELRTNESVKAIVTVADDDILAAAEVSRSGEAGEGRAAAILASVKPAFAARKARALGRGGEDVQPLRDFDTMGASFVRIRSERALLAVANHGEVTGIRVNALGQVALEQSLAHIRQPDAAAGGHRGTGTYTVVLDTGVNYAHAAFGSCTAPNSPSTCPGTRRRRTIGWTTTVTVQTSPGSWPRSLRGRRSWRQTSSQ